MDVYAVQECGCIALPEEILQRTGLRPGAIFRMAASPDGATLTLHVVQRAASAPPEAGAVCKTQAG